MSTISCLGFNLSLTLGSGQFFRYHSIDGWFYIVTRESVFRIKQVNNTLIFENSNPNFIKRFLSLDDKQDKISKQLLKDPVLNPLIRQYPGLRIIRQDPWECTLTFLCSQFSNIKKIKRNMEFIAKLHGRPIQFQGFSTYSTPPPGTPMTLGSLKDCSLGYRAPYIYKTNLLVSDHFFDSLRCLTYEEAKQRLLALPGIGPKVADCILLFSLQFGEAFPVDVWMERILKHLYFRDQNPTAKQLQSFGHDSWGAYAGYAQQYLYHWARMNPDVFKK